MSDSASGIYLAMLATESQFEDFDQARQLASVEGMRPEMFEGLERRIFEEILRSIQERRPPTVGKIWAAIPEASAFFTQYRRQIDEGYDFGSFRVARQAVLDQALSREMHGRIEEMRTLLDRNQPRDAARIATEPTTFLADSARLKIIDQHLYQGDALTSAQRTYIRTPWDVLNAQLGGGYCIGGTYSSTIVIGPTGAGKSTWIRQQVPFFLEEGHRVLYFAGEATVPDVLYEIYRLTASLSPAQLQSLTPQSKEAYLAAGEYLRRFKGLRVAAEDRFNVSDINLQATRYLAELKSQQASGEAPEHAQLLVVVDNLDHALRGYMTGRTAEHEVYDQRVSELVEASAYGGWHVLLLSQPNAEGAQRAGPAFEGDVQGGRRSANHAANILSLWRPTKAEHKDARDRNNEPAPASRHWVAVRKSRSGMSGELEFDSTFSGLWFPKGGRPVVRNLQTGSVQNDNLDAF